MKGEKGFRLVKKSEVKIKEQHSPYYIEDGLIMMDALEKSKLKSYEKTIIDDGCDANADSLRERNTIKV